MIPKVVECLNTVKIAQVSHFIFFSIIECKNSKFPVLSFYSQLVDYLFRWKFLCLTTSFPIFRFTSVLQSVYWKSSNYTEISCQRIGRRMRISWMSWFMSIKWRKMGKQSRYWKAALTSLKIWRLIIFKIRKSTLLELVQRCPANLDVLEIRKLEEKTWATSHTCQPKQKIGLQRWRICISRMSNVVGLWNFKT